MPTSKILLIVIFGIIAIMVITAAIHLIAPYAAVLAVILIAVMLVKGDSKKPPDKPGKGLDVDK